MNFINRIPIGQYVAGNSFIHQLDPRTKLLFVLYFIGLVFWADEVYTFSLLIIVTLLSVFISTIPVLYILRSLKAIFWILLLTMLIHVFMTEGGRVLFVWKWIDIHEQGVKQAVIISVRLILSMVIASLLTLTTSPLDLTDGIERLFQPLSRIGFPAHELAMMMSVALRFIPTLLEETDKIMKAQISRGADFDSGGVFKRVQNIIPLLIPLFVSSFRRAEELALAMESRGYRGAVGRTKLRELAWSGKDALFLFFAVLMGAFFIVLKG